MSSRRPNQGQNKGKGRMQAREDRSSSFEEGGWMPEAVPSQQDPSRKRQREPTSDNSRVVQRGEFHRPPPPMSHVASGEFSQYHRDHFILPLINGLSSRLRDWCSYEYFYPTIDRDYFNHNEFQQCLDALELSHLSKLRRKDWSCVRSSMGQPRRLSRAFLDEERRKLGLYRKSIHAYQQPKNSSSAAAEGFHYDVPQAIQPGQMVTAYNKHAKLLAAGQVLICDNKKHQYTIQFQRPELGIEVCHELQVAVHGRVPILQARQHVLSDRDEEVLAYENVPILMSSDQQQQQNRQAAGLGSAGKGERQTPPQVMDAQGEHDQQLETQLTLVASLAKLLERKEALLTALKEMNDDAEAAHFQGNIHSDSPGQSGAAVSESFQQQYAWLVVNIEATNKKLEPAMKQLRQMYTPQVVSPCEPPGGGGEDALKTSAGAGAVLARSRRQAHHMVHQLLQQAASAQWERKPEVGIGGAACEMVEGCLSLVNVLQACASSKMSEAEVNMAMAEALASIRPTWPGNVSLFHEVYLFLLTFLAVTALR